VRHLELGPFASDNRPILAPIELEGFAGRKGQRHEGAPAAGLLLKLPVSLPAASKRSHPPIGTFIPQCGKVGVHPLCRALLLARFVGLLPQPARQLLGEWVQLAWPVGEFELRFHRI
jgi:hypothetical protein